MHLILFFSQYNSYYGHKFAVRFTDHKEGVELTHIVNADDQTITIDSDAKRSYLRIKQEKVFGSFEDKLTYSTDTCQVCIVCILHNIIVTIPLIAYHPAYIHIKYVLPYTLPPIKLNTYTHDIPYIMLRIILYYNILYTYYTYYQGIPKGDEYVSCITKQLNTDFFRVTESKDKVKEYLDNVSTHLRNYTCSDVNMNSSPSVSTYSKYIVL